MKNGKYIEKTVKHLQDQSLGNFLIEQIVKDYCQLPPKIIAGIETTLVEITVNGVNIKETPGWKANEAQLNRLAEEIKSWKEDKHDSLEEIRNNE